MTLKLDSASDYIILSRKTAAVSFLIGTFIILYFYFTGHTSIIYFSLLFIVAAFLVNTFLVIKLIQFLFAKGTNKKSLYFTLFLLFLNLPIGYFYLMFGFSIYSHLNI